MVNFGVALRKKRNSQRTVFNKHRAVLGFLRWCGADVKALKISTPKFEKKVPRMYTDEQIAALLKAASDSVPLISGVGLPHQGQGRARRPAAGQAGCAPEGLEEEAGWQKAGV